MERRKNLPSSFLCSAAIVGSVVDIDYEFGLFLLCRGL